MNWIDNVVPPKIRSFLKRDTPENLWVKCPESGELVFHKDLEANLFVVPGSGHHMRMPVKARLSMLFGTSGYEELATPDVPTDPLRFRDVKRYTDRLKEARAKDTAALPPPTMRHLRRTTRDCAASQLNAALTDPTSIRTTRAGSARAPSPPSPARARTG